MQSFDSKKPAFLTTAHVHISLVQGLSGSALLTFCGSFVMGGGGRGLSYNPFRTLSNSLPGFYPRDTWVPSPPAQSWRSQMSPGTDVCPWREEGRDPKLSLMENHLLGIWSVHEWNQADPGSPLEMYTLLGFFFFLACLFVYFQLISLALKVIPGTFFLHLHGLTTYFQMCHSYRVAASG